MAFLKLNPERLQTDGFAVIGAADFCKTQTRNDLSIAPFFGIRNSFSRNRITVAAFIGFILGFLVVLTPQTYAQPSKAERKVEAVFLFNFVQYTDWPADTFTSESSPFVIGILGTDPFGKILDETVEGETVHGRKLEIRRFKKISDVTGCQMLFISSSEAANLKRIFAALKGRSILTVSDIENFAEEGGMIRFFKSNNKVRFRINVESAKAAHLSISAKLLQLADLVPDEPRR